MGRLKSNTLCDSWNDRSYLTFDEQGSDVVLLVLDDVPLVEERLEGLIRLNILVGQVAHFFHIDFFEECSHIDTLDDLHDILVKLLVVYLELIVLFD